MSYAVVVTTVTNEVAAGGAATTSVHHRGGAGSHPIGARHHDRGGVVLGDLRPSVAGAVGQHRRSGDRCGRRNIDADRAGLDRDGQWAGVYRDSPRLTGPVPVSSPRSNAVAILPPPSGGSCGPRPVKPLMKMLVLGKHRSKRNRVSRFRRGGALAPSRLHDRGARYAGLQVDLVEQFWRRIGQNAPITCEPGPNVVLSDFQRGRALFNDRCDDRRTAAFGGR